MRTPTNLKRHRLILSNRVRIDAERAHEAPEGRIDDDAREDIRAPLRVTRGCLRLVMVRGDRQVQIEPPEQELARNAGEGIRHK
jgi:hypothetical protein